MASRIENLVGMFRRSPLQLVPMQFTVFLVLWSVAILDLCKNGSCRSDELTFFECTPKQNGSTAKKSCFDSYTTSRSPLLKPLDIVYFSYSVLLSICVFFALHSSIIYGRIRREESEHNRRHQARKFILRALLFLVIKMIVLLFLMGLLTRLLPGSKVFTCSQRNTAMTAFSQVKINMTCSDSLYEKKACFKKYALSILSGDVLTCLCILTHLWCTKEQFLQRLLAIKAFPEFSFSGEFTLM